MKLDINSKYINYETRGDGEAILFVHGWGGSINSLSGLAHLLSKNYKVISIDLPGFGGSENPDPDWGVGEYSKFLINIIDNLKIRPVVYFGHSFGGALGIYIAAKYPTYIKKLVVSGASYKRRKSSSILLSKLLNWLPTPAKILIYKILLPDSDLYKIPALESNFRKIVTKDLTPLLSEIKQPTLILWGENDIQTPVNQATELYEKIKNSPLRQGFAGQARLKIFKHIGHNLPLKHPDKVFEEIRKF